jgi:type II secretory pathway pseudopilin PulG
VSTNAFQGTRRAGFTLTELVVAVTMISLVFIVSVPFFQSQARSVTAHAGRLDVQLNARFGLTSIERDLRTAGVGVVDAQPMIVEASPLAVTFNADLVARDTTEPGSVYVDPDASANSVVGMSHLARVRLPATNAFYPDSTYVLPGAGAPRTRAETISYYALPDASSGRPDQYVLWRRVNTEPAQVVARGIVVPSGGSIFRFFKTDSIGRLVEVKRDSLPMRHSAAMHGAVNDTARSALTDSVRVVAVELVSRAYDRRGRRDVIDTARTSVRLVNAGLLNRSTCGEPPIANGLTLFALADNDPVDNTPRVRLWWGPAIDQTGGEKDVERYVIYRRLTTELVYGEPYTSVAAGQAVYNLFDTQVVRGQSYVYGLVAQDCTPANSDVRESSPVVIP